MPEQKFPSQFHSVHLHEDMCKGCTVCVTTCPAEAIRVRNGKAHILEEKCIDCGECIRRCTHKAKYALAAELTSLKDYKYTAALLTPAIYGQFNTHYSIQMIHEAVRSLGFTEIFDVADDALEVSKATAEILDSLEENRCPYDIAKPVISTSCPTVIKLIQIRFPSLIENLLPVLPPVELTAKRARKTLASRFGLSAEQASSEIGIFLISPCPSKVTSARSPLGYEHSDIDHVFSFASLYLPIVTELRDVRKEIKTEFEAIGLEKDDSTPKDDEAPDGIAWGRECGESEYITRFITLPEKFNWITTCGLEKVIETLEAIEDGQLDAYDFAELDACAGGCLGGPLMIKAVSESSAILRNRLKNTTEKTESFVEKEHEDITFGVPLIPRPARQLSPDFRKAKQMMEKLEEINNELPGLDCACCGAPNCRALAEDIVRGNAHLEDCVFILKEKYENLLFNKKNPSKK